MTARTPKTPKTSPTLDTTKLSDEDLATREKFRAREIELATLQEEVNRASLELQGEWGFWRREVIDGKYNLKPEDTINDDGTINGR
jgi:hypothetical protein